MSGFFEDINGDKCQRTLAGFSVCAICTAIGVFESLYCTLTNKQVPTFVEFFIGAGYSLALTLLGLGVFQKPKQNLDDKNE